MLKIIDYQGNLEAVATKLDSRKESVNKEVNEGIKAESILDFNPVFAIFPLLSSHSHWTLLEVPKLFRVSILFKTSIKIEFFFETTSFIFFILFWIGFFKKTAINKIIVTTTIGTITTIPPI